MQKAVYSAQQLFNSNDFVSRSRSSGIIIAVFLLTTLVRGANCFSPSSMISLMHEIHEKCCIATHQ